MESLNYTVGQLLNQLAEARCNYTGSQQQLKAEEVRRMRLEGENLALIAKIDAARKTATTLYTNPNFRLIGLQLFNDLGEIPPNLEDKY